MVRHTVRTDAHHRAIHTAYHELFNASLIARYQTVQSFSIQFSLADVQDTLVKRYLVSIEDYVGAEFAPPSTGP